MHIIKNADMTRLANQEVIGLRMSSGAYVQVYVSTVLFDLIFSNSGLRHKEMAYVDIFRLYPETLEICKEELHAMILLQDEFGSTEAQHLLRYCVIQVDSMEQLLKVGKVDVVIEPQDEYPF